MTAALAAFLRSRFVEELEKARYAIGVVVQDPARFGVAPGDAAAHARFTVATAEVHLALPA
ncbi:hypothetical protein [Streptomyces drozdowiczii]|uniref:hypothetical protein n=1 Tax=Streptomyces drozdowiczii TaxID=202862 RepID=UPI00403C2406